MLLVKFVVTYALNIFDLIATRILISKYGNKVEANPIGRFLFQNGIAEVFKVGIVGILFVILYVIWHKFPSKRKLINFLINFLLVVFICLTIYHLWIIISV